MPEWRIFPQDVVYRPQFEGCRLANGGYNCTVGIASKQPEAAPPEAIFAPNFWDGIRDIGGRSGFFRSRNSPKRKFLGEMLYIAVYILRPGQIPLGVWARFRAFHWALSAHWARGAHHCHHLRDGCSLVRIPEVFTAC